MKSTLIAAGLVVAGCASQGHGVHMSGRAEYIESVSEEPSEPDAISAEITKQVRSLLGVNLLDRTAVGHELGGVAWSSPAERPIPDFVFSTHRGVVQPGTAPFDGIEYTARIPSKPGSNPDRAQLILSIRSSVCYEGDVLKWGLRPDHSVELVADPEAPRAIYMANSQGRTVLLTLRPNGTCIEQIELRFPEELPRRANRGASVR